MIKSIHDITIADFMKIEQSGKIGHLRSKYNILPVFFFLKRIKMLMSDIYQTINDNKLNDDEELIEWQAISILNINRIESLYLLICNELVNGVDLKILQNNIKTDRAIRRKLARIKKDKIESKLSEFIEEIALISGIEIRSLTDVIELKNHIEYKKDKYNENFNKKKEAPENKEKISILDYAGSLAIYVGTSFNGISDMKIIELIAMKKQAEAKYKAEKEQYEKFKTNQ